MNGEAGKGDRYRPVDREKYETNWERIFGKRKCHWRNCAFCDKKLCFERALPYEDPKFDC